MLGSQAGAGHGVWSQEGSTYWTKSSLARDRSTMEDPVLCPICYIIQGCWDQAGRQGKSSGCWWSLYRHHRHFRPRLKGMGQL